MTFQSLAFRRPTRPHRFASALVATLLISTTAAGCSTEDQGTSNACPSTLTFDGNEYNETPTSAAELPTDKKLGMGVLPTCGDFNDASGGNDDRVEVWSVDGVATDQGLAAMQGGEFFFYVASGLEDPCSVKYTVC